MASRESSLVDERPRTAEVPAPPKVPAAPAVDTSPAVRPIVSASAAVRLRPVLGSGLLALSIVVASFETHALWSTVRPYGWQSATVGGLWQLLSDLGRGPAIVGVVAVAAVLEPVAWRRQLVVTAALVPSFVGMLLKFAVARPRPIPDLLLTSWPSGHSISAFGLAMALSAGHRRPRLGVWSVAVGIAASRVMVERHWPSDVIGGLAVCVLTVPLLARLPVAARGGDFPARALIAVGALWLAVILTMAVRDPWTYVLPRSWALAFGFAVVLRGLWQLGRPRPAASGPDSSGAAA